MTSVPNVSLSAGTTSIDIPQLGFGVWQVPDDEVDRRGLHRPRGRLPQHRHRPALRQRGGRRRGPRHAPTCRARSSSSPPRSGTTTRARRDAARVRRVDEAPRPRGPRPLPHPLARAGAGHVRRHLEGAAASCATRAASAPSASATSSVPHLSGCSTRPASSRPSTRSSCTRTCSRRSCASSTPSTASSPRRGARWPPAATCSPTRSSPGSREQHGVTPAQVDPARGTSHLGNVVIPKSVTPSPHRRELRRSSASRSTPATSPRSRGSTAATAPARTPTSSRADSRALCALTAAEPPGPAGTTCRPRRRCGLGCAP